MKRLYIAVLFIALIISACVYEQIKVNSFYDTACEYIDEASLYADSGDYEGAYNTCNEFDSYYQKQYKCLSLMLYNNTLDDMNITIHELKALAKNKDTTLESKLLAAKIQAQQIKSNQKICLENIL